MGLKMSKNVEENNCVNHYCPKCMESGKLPNIAGRFCIINETECQCNGCKTIYLKSKFYKIIIENATLLKEPAS